MKRKVLKTFFALALVVTMGFGVSTITVEAKADLPAKPSIDYVALETALENFDPMGQLLVNANCIHF